MAAPTPEDLRLLREAQARATEVTTPELMKRQWKRSMPKSIKALKLFVANVEGCELYEIQAAVRWLVARFIDDPPRGRR